VPEIEVGVYRSGREICRVVRPIHIFGTARVVTYKGRKYRVGGGDVIDLDKGCFGLEQPLKLPPAVEPEAPAPFIETAADTPAPSPRIPGPDDWDHHQTAVIRASRAARLLVDAGPGTGKTAVACSRISHLVDDLGVEPSHVWLISFTRTAVREMRNRLVHYLGDREAAFAVRIATLDSHAWAINTGFDERATLGGSHERNIEDVLRLVREDDQVADYMDTVEHLLIDEAQDIVGVRADLVTAIIARLSSSCGVTVFSDQAQAIYGFADVDVARADGQRPAALVDRLAAECRPAFERASLTTIFRTRTEDLLSIFTETRALILAPAMQPAAKLATIQDQLRHAAPRLAAKIEEWSLSPDTLVLYRRRADVLTASAMLNNGGIRHRLRMSGTPVCVMPWVGATLAEIETPTITRTAFSDIWEARVAGAAPDGLPMSDAWAALVRHAGRSATVVDMRRLRAVLSRSQPPAEFCYAELGTGGPVVGTVHASKGREAATVHLMLPGEPGENTDFEEEARVVFVGATRARHRLFVGEGFRRRGAQLDSGRSFSLLRGDTPRAQVEFGCRGDLTADGAAGMAHFPSPTDVRAAQLRILALADGCQRARAAADPKAGYALRLYEEGSEAVIAGLAPALNKDLFQVAKAVGGKRPGGPWRPPLGIPHLFIIGARTLVLPPDSPVAATLHRPWAQSGIVLLPVITGFAALAFRQSHQGSNR
jgi:hypothetical protein